MKDGKLRYFSMFSGVGGFELGIGDKGECIGFSENDKFCSQLLSQKFPGIKNYGDATKIDPDELPDFDLLCGGFPCQAFSIAGKREGFRDTRGTLFLEIVRVLQSKRPKYLLLENVKGLLNHDKGKTFQIIIQTLDELGYDLEWMVLNSLDFGVPQSRKRVFIRGTLRKEQGKINVSQRAIKKAPLLLECKKRSGNKDFDWKEIGRVSSEIIREDAGIPHELD